jgi:hypothetical protein
MFRVLVEYYNQIEPITYDEFRAFTKRGAIRKAFKYSKKLNETVYYMQVWFKGKKIFGNGNRVLYKTKEVD